MSAKEPERNLFLQREISVTLKVKRDDLDNVLEEIGGCSHFQVRRHVLFFLMSIPLACQNLLMVFAGQNPDMCIQETLTHCIDIKKYPIEKACPWSKNHRFHHDTSFSTVTEFGLVCERSYVNQIVNSAYFIGAVFGSVFIGWISDKFGRKSVLFGCYGIVILISGMSALSKTLWFFVMARFLIGFFLSGFALALYVIAAEIVSPSRKSSSAAALLSYNSVGLMILALKAYLLQNWRHLQLVTTIPYVVFFLFYRYTPDSLRWLWSTGKYKRANNVIETIAKENKREECLNRFSNILSVENDNIVLCDLKQIFKHRKLFMYICILIYISLTNGIIYYGFFLVSDNISGDLYLYFVLLAVMEIPANFLSIYSAGRFGRKKTVIVSFVFTCLLNAVLVYVTKTKKSNWQQVNLGIALFGKFFLSTALVSSNIWCCEIFPLIAKSKGLGVLTATRLLGGAIAPWLTEYFIRTYPAFPFAVMGALAGTSGLFCLLLPETRETAIEETSDVLETSDVKIGTNQDMNDTELCFDYVQFSTLDRETVL